MASRTTFANAKESTRGQAFFYYLFIYQYSYSSNESILPGLRVAGIVVEGVIFWMDDDIIHSFNPLFFFLNQNIIDFNFLTTFNQETCLRLCGQLRQLFAF